MIWDDNNYIAFDFETSGKKPEYALQPWRAARGDAWATSLVWVRKAADGLKIEGGLDPTPAMMRAMLEDAIARKARLVGWNTVFDIGWLLAYGMEDLVAQVRFLDGLLLWKHHAVEPEYEIVTHKKKAFDLKSCVAEVLPDFAGYEEDIDFHNPDPVVREQLHAYNIRDSAFTLRLAKHWWNKLEPPQQAAALIEAECLPMVAAANLRGLVVDTLAARELEAKLSRDADRQLAILSPHGVDETTIRSPAKLGRLLFDQWKLPVLKENTSKKTGRTTRSTDKETLYELSFSDPRAHELRLYREALNNRTKFATALVASAEYNEDGRTHPSCTVFSTYSGRMSYSSTQRARGIGPTGRDRYELRQTGFALHQEKRDPLFRSVVIAPPGYKIVEFDASGQEFRWMAIASKDEVMLQLCAPGEDPHAFMGARIASVEYAHMLASLKAGDAAAKESRQLGKVGNLSLQYRTSARKLRSVARVQYGLPMELPQAQQIHAIYQHTYQGVPVYWTKQIAVTKRLGYVETFAGRRVQVIGHWDGKLGWSMGSTAINYRIQGTGADQKYLAMAVIKPYLRKIGAQFAFDLHDGIYLFVPDAAVDRAVVEIKQKLDTLPYEQAWGFSPPIPLPWDCKVGASWGALREIKH